MDRSSLVIAAAIAAGAAALAHVTACSSGSAYPAPSSEGACTLGALSLDTAPPSLGDPSADAYIACVWAAYKPTSGLSASLSASCVELATALGAKDSWSDAGADVAVAGAACAAAEEALKAHADLACTPGGCDAGANAACTANDGGAPEAALAKALTKALGGLECGSSACGTATLAASACALPAHGLAPSSSPCVTRVLAFLGDTEADCNHAVHLAASLAGTAPPP